MFRLIFSLVAFASLLAGAFGEHNGKVILGPVGDDIGESLKDRFTFPDRPLQLVRPDAEHRGLVIVEETLQVCFSRLVFDNSFC